VCSSDLDYTSSALEPSFPDGMDVEIFTFDALEQAWREATLPSQREHVTPFIYAHPERFKIGSYKNVDDLSALRWTVDEQEDLDLVTILYETLYPGKPDFNLQDILDLVHARPELQTLNTRHTRNEGMLRSKEKDQEFLNSKERHV
jgi:spore coat polysaccharide biosynthesis protein SpsF